MLNTTAEGVYSFIFRPGATLVRSVESLMPELASWAAPTTVTAMPTSCSRCSRRWAVTTICST